MSGLTAHHAAANDPLGVLHRDAPFTALDKDDESYGSHHHHHQQDQRRNGERPPGLVAALSIKS